MKKLFVVTVVVFSLITAESLKANPVYQLDIFTNNGRYADSDTINLNFQVVQENLGVDFIFHNESTIDCSIARIYFDDNSLLTYKSITNGAGTNFSKDSSPGNLPAGHTLSPTFAADFSFGAKSPPPKNGINPGEELTISFNFKQGKSYNDIINALNEEDLRIGTHLIALPDGSSESAIIDSKSSTFVPEPATLSILILGGLILRRKKKSFK